MRMRLVTAFALVLGLALGLNARADDKDKDKDKDRNQGATSAQTIRGTLAGIAVEGEMVIDARTNRAVETDLTMLTIVGYPVRHDADKDNDKNKDNAKSAKRGRQNVYVVWLTPRTKFRDDSGQAKPTDAQAAQGNPWEALEVGDRVEVTFTPRDLSLGANQPHRRKHGRHRIYFGDASMVTILAPPAHDSDKDQRDDEHRGDKDKDKDKDSK